jgi:hypothetical protein
MSERPDDPARAPGPEAGRTSPARGTADDVGGRADGGGPADVGGPVDEAAPEGSLAGEDRQLTPQSTADRDTVDVDAAKDGEPG